MRYTNVTIGEKHSHDDFDLVLLKLAISPPEANTHLIDVPGRATRIDATQSLYGEITYKNRAITMDFIHYHKGFGVWMGVYSNILNTWHGQRLQIIFDDDPTFYYIGRVSVSSAKESPLYASFTVTVDAEPYKYDVNGSTDPWEWDSFEFGDNEIVNYDDIWVGAGKSMTINVSGASVPVRPVVSVTRQMKLKVGTSEYTLIPGMDQKLGEKVGTVPVPFVFINSGPYDGQVRIEFRGERL